MDPCTTEPWWAPATAVTQRNTLSHPSSLIFLYALSYFGFYCSYLFSILDCFISILAVQLLEGSYNAAIKLQIKSGYWIAAFIIHQTLQFGGSSVRPAWKMRQVPNTNKTFPRGATWIWRYITHNAAHNLSKRLLFRAKEELHQPPLKVKRTLVLCLGDTGCRIRPTVCHWINPMSRLHYIVFLIGLTNYILISASD